MGLTRRFNYQSKLFLPLVGVLWLLIFAFSYFQISREKQFKSDYIRDRIDIINARLIDLYERNDTTSQKFAEKYMKFLERYYEGTVFEDLSMTLYDTFEHRVIKSIGFEAPIDPEGTQGIVSAEALRNDPEADNGKPKREAFYYKIDRSPDGRYAVQTYLPYDSRVEKEISGGRWWWWGIVLFCVLVTILSYLTTRHLVKSIKLLRTFTDNIANNSEHIITDKFPDDELGDISRQIVNIYNTRQAAVKSRELEHSIAIKATEERNNLRRQMTNNINHELKTPATIIKGYLDTIVDNPEMDAESRMHFINKAHVQIDRLCNILNDLSAMTRLDEAAQNVQVEGIDFRKYLAELAVDIEESGIGGDMKFEYDVPAGCIVKINHTLLNSALMNLVKNAAAYSKGTRMGVKLLTSNKRFYTFVFYDDGTGVPEEHIPMLFERFYRVDKGRSRKAGGTGLGLPIVRSSLNTMGGSISVRNAEPHGLEFVFTLGVWHDN